MLWRVKVNTKILNEYFRVLKSKHSCCHSCQNLSPSLSRQDNQHAVDMSRKLLESHDVVSQNRLSSTPDPTPPDGAAAATENILITA